MIIGLTGKNAAGKGEIAKHLESKHFKYFSLSDALRDEAKSQGLDHSRSTLIKLGTKMREKFGNNILAVRINEKISEFKKQNIKDFVIDSIRNPGEIEELRKNEDFILLGVHTDTDIRYKRLLARKRQGDANTLEEFKEHEDKENNNEGSGQQLDKCLKLADKIINSNGTIKQANDDLDEYLETLKSKS